MSFETDSFNSRDMAVQKGLSLVELLVALALSAILILGIFTVYMDSSQTSRLSTSLARIQESARIGVDILARDLRMVGFQGCADPDDVTMNVIADNPPTNDFFSTTLRVWEVTGANWADGTEFDGLSIEANARVGSDVIAIQRGEMANVDITGNMDNTNANIQVGGAEVNQFSQNDMVLISDCESADLFRISSKPSSDTWAHASNVNSGNNLSQAYNENARVMRFSSTIYYVADTGRDDSLGNDIYALYRARDNLLNSATPDFQIDELVEGVESLQAELGEKLPSNSFRYATADDASLDLTRVVAARIGLLVSDTERVRNDNDQASYDLPGELITAASGAGAVKHPEDRRLRRSFIATVTLRNRD
ncbi:prepilin-type N-terminal cleavage/methylation domain-containing protein [Marinobacter panjinensis]|uniref:Prepilin-type N-terminal cleavage/methylation domain-containing protein n=1 Tax=Marinobacter panjinensis TaxID=2576384 RepID=A0A4U6QQU5_9GAMM|nr:PilW family protein [Marinobacter panjinensis]MCR8916522.1 PilW family protein [Marinobacter panjinensis]TKV63264.1 prepilin-type N-terminal cleavage/methylation domain-containing protein [Marinobacter panjinensis]